MRSLVDAALAAQEQRILATPPAQLRDRNGYRLGRAKECAGGCGVWMKATSPYDRCFTCRSK